MCETVEESERATEWGYRLGGGEGGGGIFYRISCLAWSHFFSPSPSVLQSELFGRPGRWQIGLVKGAATTPTPQPLTRLPLLTPNTVSLTCTSISLLTLVPNIMTSALPVSPRHRSALAIVKWHLQWVMLLVCLWLNMCVCVCVCLSFWLCRSILKLLE